MKPDIICTQPSHVDFPMWRYYLEKHKDCFNEIFVGFSNAHRKLNLLQFELDELTKIGVKVVTDMSYLPQHDWRSSAINKCLAQSRSDRVLFLEQDFIAFSEDFWKEVTERPEPLVGFKESKERQGRLHPAFMLVNRDLLNKTSLQFSAMPPQFDHFGKISEELEAQVAPVYLEDLFPNQWEHLAGLTHNYSLIMDGGVPNHNVPRFGAYNRDLLKLPVSQSPQFHGVILNAANY